jgi:capsid protein
LIAPRDDSAAVAFLGELSRQAQRGSGSLPARSKTFRRVNRGDRVEAAYDAAQTTEQNSGYWAKADLLSADAANSPEIRRTLRSRSRYECLEANPFAQGIVKSLAVETIGRGPTLQMSLPNDAANVFIEQQFAAWARRVKLAKKLRVVRKAKFVDGEVFIRLVTNRRLKGPIKLDIEVIEADRIANPSAAANPPDLRMWAEVHGFVPQLLTDLDGVIFDHEGNVVAYRVLKFHPGGNEINGFTGASELVPAEQMVHLFRQDRAGQHRGVPESTPALPLFILMRDYTLAVVQNARSVAKHTVLMKTQAGTLHDESGDSAYPIDPFEAVDIDYDMQTYLPKGWEPYQLRAEQPATTFEMFRNAIWNEIARCADMPFNIAAANSAKMNYSSGRLDYQLWDRFLDVERCEIGEDALDPIFEAWFDEGVLAGVFAHLEIGAHDELPHEWFWTGRGHVDPTKEAMGVQIDLKSGITSRTRELKRRGIDRDTHDAQAAEDYGMSVQEYRRTLARGLFNLQQPEDVPPVDHSDEDENEDEDFSDGEEEFAEFEAQACA